MEKKVKEELIEKVSEDSEVWRIEKIKELESKKELDELETDFLEFLKKNDVSGSLRDAFFELNEVFEYYMDDTPQNIVFYSLWVIGTYFHDQFLSYPYLFLNAMRGSGKSRLLKLLSFLGKGKYTSSITEPILFRTTGLLCIDELESIGGKDKAALRELLNAAYKKGMTIIRMKKAKGIDGENYVPEEFEIYRPIALANIWGMDEVLGDRCITRILEKSDDGTKTRRMEDFDFDLRIKKICRLCCLCSLCSKCRKKTLKTYGSWNAFLDKLHDKLHYNTNNTNNTNDTNYTKEELFYEKIYNINITGRNLELFFPIFVVANLIGEDILDTTLDIAKVMVNEKRDVERLESVDVLVYSFIANLTTNLDFLSLRQLLNEFRVYADLNYEWLNEKWFGKSLKRLNLLLDKKRLSGGVSLIPNIAKAKEKIKMFKDDDTPEK